MGSTSSTNVNTNAHNNNTNGSKTANQQIASVTTSNTNSPAKATATTKASTSAAQNKQDKKPEPPKAKEGDEQGVDPETLLPHDQVKFDSAIRFASLLIKPESIEKHATRGVQKLELKQALPHTMSLFTLLQSLPNLQILDISGNQLGPPGFRAVMLSLCNNSTLTTLNIADNQTDTDSADCIGKMLRANKCLTCLNVSGNYLGLDFFSRCVGPALAQNKTLQMLRCESIGSTDLNVLGENLKNNTTLTSLSINSNELSNPMSLVENIASWIKESSCVLSNLQLRRTGLKSDCLDILTDALNSNSSLETLDISANECTKASSIMNLLLNCVTHCKLKTLTADDIRAGSCDCWTPTGAKKLETPSCLQTLTISGCSLTDDYFTALHRHLGDASMPGLVELNLTSNTDLTNTTLKTFVSLTCSPASDVPQGAASPPWQSPPTSSITTLSYGHNNAQNLSEILITGQFPKLEYLNLRRAKISAAGLEQLVPVFGKNGTIGTLVLDGLKLAGSGVFGSILEKDSKLVALSVASCQLNDSDLTPLCTAIKAGLPVHMLKLSDNRLTDAFTCTLCDALQSRKAHPLALIDISSNNVTLKGAKRFTDLLNSKSKSQLQSLNLSYNGIEAAGVVGLVGCVGKTSLQSLNVSNQTCTYYEEDCENIYKEITKSLGMKVIQEDDSVKLACCDLPKLPDYISYKLTSLGGCPGELGKALHSKAISTDYIDKKVAHLTLQDALQIASHLKGQDSPDTVLSSEEWAGIIGTKDTPTWLQVAKHRGTALYMSGLPASITTQKMEGLLESEADCNVEEICLLKDMVTRKNNGLAWLLMSDEDSVNRAIEFYNKGEAQVFSQPFTISRLRVRIDDEASSDAKAKQDMAARSLEKKREEAAHRALIEQSYLESQARHAYRLAHPAYADGRIW